MPANLENSPVTLALEKISFHSCTHFACYQVNAQNPSSWLQQYMNWELPGIQDRFRKGRGTRDQITNICQIIEKAREFQKNTNFCFIGYAKAFDCVDHKKLWKILKDLEHQTLYLPPEKPVCSQQTTVRTRHGKMDWLQIWKGVHQCCIFSPCLFNFYAKYICKMLGWMNHRGESRLWGEISTASDMQVISFYWQKAKRNWRASWCWWKRRVKRLA